MDAHVKSVREILHSGDQYLVPFFQRRYDWRRPHWQRLLDDILALCDQPETTNHFLGPLVCTPLPPVPGEVTSYQLIDGQQRLTTITVALAALRDVVKPAGYEDVAAEIHEDYLVHRRRQGLQKLKVVPRLTDRADYESMIEGTMAGTTASEGIIGAYSFFKRAWRKQPSRSGNDETVFRALLAATTARLSLVTITVREENPYEIFESLNSTGLPLEEADLIRNFIFMQVPPDQQRTFHDQHWDPFERRFHATSVYAALPLTSFYRSYLTLQRHLSLAPAADVG